MLTRGTMNIKLKYLSYKKRCKSKGMDFRLSLWKFEYYISKPCFICKKANAGGLDRLDNTIGYTERNVAPCCFDCNRMKSNKTKEQFMEYLARLNPDHSLLSTFNKLKDTSAFNKKMKSLERLMVRRVNLNEDI